MGPSAREQPNEPIDSSPDNMSQVGSLEHSPTTLINSYADRNMPDARHQKRSVQIGDDITGSIKRRVIKPVKVETGSGITQINKLSDTNWANWREDIIRMLNFLKVKDYLLGKIPRPDSDLDPDKADAWDHNDSYALQ